MVHWESFGELKVFKILDCDRQIKAFSEQPFTIHYLIAGHWQRHYPDILVEKQHSREVWEIKEERTALLPEVQARTALLERELPKLGLHYRLIDRRLYDEPGVLEHAETLLRSGRGEITLFDRELMRRLFADVSPITWQAAKKGEYGPRGRQILCRLTLEGKLDILGQLPSSQAQFIWREGDN